MIKKCLTQACNTTKDVTDERERTTERRDVRSEPQPSNLEPDELSRLAQLVARDEVPLPTELAPEQLQTIVHEVSAIRRSRLIRFVARQIAQHIRNSRKDDK